MESKFAINYCACAQKKPRKHGFKIDVPGFEIAYSFLWCRLFHNSGGIYIYIYICICIHYGCHCLFFVAIVYSFLLFFGSFFDCF